MMTRCIRPRAGALWPLALPMIPYMRANLAREAPGLARRPTRSSRSARRSRRICARARRSSQATRIEIIPNPVNDRRRCAARAAATAPAPARPVRALPRQAGAQQGQLAVSSRSLEQAELDWPLVVAGDGPDRAALERAAAARSDRDVRLIGWIDQEAAAAWLAHASMLIFPSRGPESLSRVLIEASALGVPIAAMNTGGTPDIVVDEETGLLSATPEELAADVRRLRAMTGCAGGSERRRGRAPNHASTRGRRRADRAALRRARGEGRPRMNTDAQGNSRERSVRAPLRVAVVRARCSRSTGSAASSAASTISCGISRGHGVRGHADHPPPVAAGRRPSRSIRASGCGSCRIARSRWPAGAGRPSSIAAPRIRCSASGPGGPPGSLSSRGPSISSTDSARACSATRAAGGARARRSCSIRRGWRSSARPIRRARRLKRAAYLPLRRAVVACARAADCVIATDRALEPAVRAHLGVPPERVRVIPNALDLRGGRCAGHGSRRCRACAARRALDAARRCC